MECAIISCHHDHVSYVWQENCFSFMETVNLQLLIVKHQGHSNTTCQPKVQKVAQISLVLFGPYSPSTTWATLDSHPDYTLPRALHVCQKYPSFVLGYLGHICYFKKWATLGSHPFRSGHKKCKKCCIIGLSGPHPYVVWEASSDIATKFSAGSDCPLLSCMFSPLLVSFDSRASTVNMHNVD